MTRKHNQTKSILPWTFGFGVFLSLCLPTSSAANARYESTMRTELKKQDKQLAPMTADDGESNVALDGDLSSYLAYAMNRSPRLRASFERWRSAVYKISAARALPEPTISYGFYVLSVETRLGPQRHKVGLQQSFPWPTRLTAGADSASAKARAMQRRFDADALDLRATVAQAYWRLWLLRETISIQTQVLEVARSSSDTIEARLVLGGASLADKQRIDLFVARLADAIETNRLEESAAGAELTAAIGAPPGTPTPTTEDPLPIALPGETDAALREATATHPAIQFFTYQAQGSDDAARSLRAQRFPSLTLGVDWIETGPTTMPDVPDSGRDALILGVGIKLPLWQGIYKDSQDASLAEAESFRADGQSAADQLIAALGMALATVKNTYRTIRLHQHTLIPQVQTAFESVMGAYSTGRSSVEAILMTQRDLLDLRLTLARSLAGHEMAWVQLEQRAGREVSRAVADSAVEE